MDVFRGIILSSAPTQAWSACVCVLRAGQPQGTGPGFFASPMQAPFSTWRRALSEVEQESLRPGEAG